MVQIKDWIKRYWIIIVLVLISSIFVIKNLYHLLKKQENAPVNMEMKKLDTKVDENGNKYVSIPSTPVSKEQMKSIIDSLKLTIKPTIVTSVITRTDTVFSNIPIYIDSNNFFISKNDGYLSLKIEGNTETRQSSIHLSTIDTLTFAPYTKKHLLKSNEQIVNVYNKSPYNTISQGQSFTMKEQKVIATFGPQVGYNPITEKMYYGVGITFNIFSIKSRK